MKQLIYRVTAIDKDFKTVNIFSSKSEKEARKEFDNTQLGDNESIDLSVGWELNGRSLGTTSLDWKDEYKN